MMIIILNDHEYDNDHTHNYDNCNNDDKRMLKLMLMTVYDTVRHFQLFFFYNLIFSSTQFTFRILRDQEYASRNMLRKSAKMQEEEPS